MLLELYIALSWAELADFSEFVGKDEQASAEESRAGSQKFGIGQSFVAGAPCRNENSDLVRLHTRCGRQSGPPSQLAGSRPSAISSLALDSRLLELIVESQKFGIGQSSVAGASCRNKNSDLVRLHTRRGRQSGSPSQLAGSRLSALWLLTLDSQLSAL